MHRCSQSAGTSYDAAVFSPLSAVCRISFCCFYQSVYSSLLYFVSSTLVLYAPAAGTAQRQAQVFRMFAYRTYTHVALFVVAELAWSKYVEQSSYQLKSFLGVNMDRH